VELPPAMPFTCHVTAAFDVPDTVAANDCVCPRKSVAACGAIIIEIGEVGGVEGGVGGEAVEPPAHPHCAI